MSMSMSVVPRWRRIKGVVLINLRFFNHIQSYLRLSLSSFPPPAPPHVMGLCKKEIVILTGGKNLYIQCVLIVKDSSIPQNDV